MLAEMEPCSRDAAEVGLGWGTRVAISIAMNDTTEFHLGLSNYT